MTQPSEKKLKEMKKDSKASEVEALREKLSAARKELTLKKAPLSTSRLFLGSVVGFTVHGFITVLKSWITWLLVVPLVVAWFAGHQFAPELFVGPVCGETEGALLWKVELAMQEAAWWITLGVLSSVGFGTGLHSGLMFLFPHVMQTVAAAEGCHTTDGLISWYNHPCKLQCSTTVGPKDDSTVTFLRLWLLVTVQCMLWGAGTAAGELPPYMVSKAARTSGGTDEEYEAELEASRDSTDAFSRLKMWTINFTQKYGFMGVFLMASWPNAAFDMCGMCCGYLLMPFWTFFIACLLGKGIVKVNMQAVFFVNLFGTNFFRLLCSGIDRLNAGLQGVIGKDLALRALLEKGRRKLVSKFEMQSRFLPAKLFESAEAVLDIAAVKKIYDKLDDGDAVAARVLEALDTDSDGNLTLAEVGAAASRTDGMVSLGSLDPGKGTGVLKMCWELFIVGLILFFVFSVVEQLAQTKQAELDNAKVEELEKKLRKKK